MRYFASVKYDSAIDSQGLDSSRKLTSNFRRRKQPQQLPPMWSRKRLHSLNRSVLQWSQAYMHNYQHLPVFTSIPSLLYEKVIIEPEEFIFLLNQ